MDRVLQCSGVVEKGAERAFALLVSSSPEKYSHPIYPHEKVHVINTSFILQSSITIHLWKFSHSAATYVINVEKTRMRDMTFYLIRNFAV